ncbi:hypothetical protein [Microscilla marina]|uniref:Uncharacterized protein n=1 Tax=Microscilla marina ATCC 23134 TaxID=313606 RepID=A1ZYR8_MICM2|nr:hypothetical protein [Microscilla marina]EAY24492.1 hypothetical protein M23134_06479 [Microscilla marina ATCC 23134]
MLYEHYFLNRGSIITKDQTSTPEKLHSRILGLEMIDWKAMKFIQHENIKASTNEQYQKVVSHW